MRREGGREREGGKEGEGGIGQKIVYSLNQDKSSQVMLNSR